MKKLLAVIITVFLTAGLCGCNFHINYNYTEPEEIVNNFFQAIETKNEDVLILYTKNEDINMLLHSKGNESDLKLMYTSLFKNFSYKIGSVTKNEDETQAEVEVSITNVDFSKVLQEYQKKAYKYMQDNLYSGDMDKKELNKKCMNLFAQQVEKAGKSKKSNTSTLTVHLDKNDNYGWDLELTEEMMEKIMGGLIIPL